MGRIERCKGSPYQEKKELPGEEARYRREKCVTIKETDRKKKSSHGEKIKKREKPRNFCMEIQEHVVF